MMDDFFNFDYTPDSTDYSYDFSPVGYDYSSLSEGYDSPSFDLNFDLNPNDIYSLGGTGTDYSSLSSPYSSSIMDSLNGMDWKGLASTGLGALSMYGNYRANRDQTKAMMIQAKAQEAQMKLARDQALADQAKSLASKAAISNILASRGHLSPNNSNPWLNYIFQAQKGGNLTPTGSNPFPGYDVGQPVGSGMDLSQLMAGLEAQTAAAPRPQLAGGGLLKGALNALRHSNLDGLEAKLVKPHELPRDWVTENTPEISDDYLNIIRQLNQRLNNPLDEEAEREFIQRYLSTPHGKAAGGSTNAGPVRGYGGGQDDVVQAEMAPGEYVLDAESVSALGDGNNEEGARKLDEMRKNIRKHKRGGALSSIPPRAKDPMKYFGGK